MKTHYLLFLLALYIPFSTFSQEVRKTLLFNEDWKFYKGDLDNGQDIKFEDQSWRKVDLPHDWSIEGPFSEEWASGTGYLPGGIAWYRKSFTLSPDIQSKHIFIYFDGVYKNSEVWINGHYLGKRPNGFIPFEYELSDYLNKNGNNVIAVKVDHSKFADSRYYTGSGIYRNVYLVAKNPVHIDLWGVAFTTPEVSKNSSKAKVAVTVNNASSQASNVIVKGELLSSDGKVVAQTDKQLSLKEGDKSEAELSFQVENPRLWSIDNPNLYRLNVSLFIDDEKVDDYTEQVGFRSIRFDANEGFFLNGENIKLKGVCIHHDAGALGAAVPREAWERRLRKLKEVGCNAVRMSHYPHQGYLYELFDQMGFVVQDEAFDEWEVGKNKWIEGWNVGTPGNDGSHEEFDEWADRDLKDMILRNRNRPSIIMWSIGNEIDYPNDPYSHEVLNTGRNPQIYGRAYQPDNPPASRLGEIAKRLVKVVKETDATRPVTAALAGVVMSNFTDYPDLLDIVGYNYQEYRYPEDHEKYPNRIIYGSENGKNLDAWLAVDTNKYISSQFLWTGFDFMGEARTWPSRSSGAGLMDLAGFPKTDFYFRQSLWSDDPMVYMTASKINNEQEAPPNRGRATRSTWNWDDGDKVRVRAISNAEEVELFLNGESLGKKSMKNSKREEVFWEVDYHPGELIIKGYNNAKETSHYALKTAGSVYLIAATTDKKTFGIDEKELAHIEIELHDKDGNPVYDATNEITIDIEGPAKLIGLESGNLSSHEDYKANKRKAYNGKLLAYVQSEEKSGIVRIIISSPGLISKVVEINHTLVSM
jgi:hypothetical protein